MLSNPDIEVFDSDRPSGSPVTSRISGRQTGRDVSILESVALSATRYRRRLARWF